MSGTSPYPSPPAGQPLPTGPVTRRTLLRGAGVLGMGAGVGLPALLAACGVAADDNGSGGPPGGGAGGTLTLGIDATSAVNDPAFYTSLGDWMAVDCICRGLTFISFETNEPQPDLAENWDVSDDGLVYTFHLRRDVTFHDGTPLTSADVLASLARQADPENPTLPDGATRPLASLFADVEELNPLDDHTVELVLAVENRTVLARLSDIGGRIISAAALDEHGPDIGKHLVGSGPFRFSSATAGQSVALEAFEDFRLGRPPIDRLVLQQVQDPSSIVSSLISGSISATQFTPYSALDRLSNDDAVVVHDTPFSFDAIMMLDARRIPELAVRQAINLAIDREAIIAQAFFGAAVPPDGFAIPPSQNGYDPDLADLSRFDPAEARQLLEGAGAVGREVGLMAASDSWHPRAAQIVAQNLADIGLVVRTDSVDPATYFGRLLDPDDPYHDLMIWERNSYIPDPDNMVGAMARPAGVYGEFISGMNTLDGAEDFHALLDDAKNLPDGAERTAAYSAIQRRWVEEYLVLSMLACSTNPVASGANVQGMNVAALSSHRCFMDNASV